MDESDVYGVPTYDDLHEALANLVEAVAPVIGPERRRETCDTPFVSLSMTHKQLRAIRNAYAEARDTVES